MGLTKEKLMRESDLPRTSLDILTKDCNSVSIDLTQIYKNKSVPISERKLKVRLVNLWGGRKLVLKDLSSTKPTKGKFKN